MRAPGIEALYSGVAITTASAAARALRSRATAGPASRPSGVGVVRRQRLEPGPFGELDSGRQLGRRGGEQVPVEGALAEAAAIPTTLISGGLRELELGGKLDLPADRVATVGERQLPTQAPVAPVDRGVERERNAHGAERVHGRRPIAALDGDRLADAPDRELAPDARAAVVA